MGVIQHIWPWSTQPQESVLVNRDHPWAPDYVFSAGSGPMLFGRQHHFSTGRHASDSFRPTRLGVAFKPTRNTNAGLNFGAIQPIRSNVYTIVVLANPGSGDEVSVLFSQRVGSGGYNQLDFTANATTGLAHSAGSLHTYYVNTDLAERQSSIASVVNGNYRVFATSRNGNGAAIKLFVDGVAQAATTSGTADGTLYTATQETRIGNLGDFTTSQNFAASCDIPLVLIWDGRELPAVAQEQIAADLLNQVAWWAEPLSIPIPTAAAASSLPTLSDATFVPGSVTSSGWRPSFTATY